MAMHTWFQLGGPALHFAEPENIEQLSELLAWATAENLPVKVLGSGSNILVRDEGIRALVISLTHPHFQEIKVDGTRIVAGGGAKLGRVVTTAVHAGLGGMEELVAIPGTIGGALRGNAGTTKNDIGQWTHRVTVMTESGQVVDHPGEEILFDYRKSSIDEPIILEAVLQLEEDDPRQLAKRMQKMWIVRKSKQPMGHQSAGCIFKNPTGLHAGELIDDSGLKGTRIGGATVSDRHANFIIAEPECTASDVLRLIDLVRNQVDQRMGVELELEIEVW
ncbi:MAG: UDP-N-acetylmuramate dehydrogenase [Planctomycetia bacterium]|jgi:UDP-N-acetylmuramate dehydrogenase